MTLGHGGSIDGFESNLAYFPEDDLVIAACFNGVEYPANDILIGILSRVFGVPHELPTFELVEVDVELLKKYMGVYTADNFPLDITIAVDGKKLTAQGTGQPSFPLKTVSDVEFKYDPASIKMKFIKVDDGFDIEFKQGPTERTFTRSK